MDIPEIIWIGANKSNFKIGGQSRSEAMIAGRLIICHHEMEGSLAGTDDHFGRKRVSPSSAHYGVGKDGTIHQYVRDVDIAYSNGNVLHPNLAAVPWLAQYENNDALNANDISLSIEWEGAHSWVGGIVGGTVKRYWEPANAQYSAGLALTRYLAAKYAVRIDRSHITRHSDFDSVNKGWCPGDGFPLGPLINALQGGPRETLFVDYDASVAKPVSVKGPPKVSPNVFQAVLQEQHSPVWEYAESFYRTCVQHWIDPAVALAFFGKESTFGTDPNNLYKSTWNFGNIVADNSLGKYAKGAYPFAGHLFRVYPDPIIGLQDWCELWDSPVYRGKTLREQIAIYAPSSDHNNPDAYAEFVETTVRALETRSLSFTYLGAL